MKSGIGTAPAPMTFKPLFEADRCLRAGTGWSTCARCREVCPAAGFRLLSNGIEIPDACCGCDFCTAVCPAGAIRGPLPSVSILERKRVTLRCSRCGGRNGVQIPCVGALPVSLLAALAGKQIPVTVFSGDCENCSLQGGVVLFQKRLAELGGPSWKPEVTRGTGEMDHPKRVLFATLGRAVAGGFHAATDYEAAMSRSRWRPALTENCTGCPVCESVCPREVLVREETRDQVTYYVNTGACNGCRKCVESCMLDGVRLEPAPGTDDFPQVGSYHFNRKRCEVCGISYTGANTSTCPRCRKESRDTNFRLRMGSNSGIPLRMEK